jgi:leucyl/phenylalanyl-tRNA--protein transferase
LVERLAGAGACLLDVQWTTPHLVSLGAVDVARPVYLAQLAEAVAVDAEPFPRPSLPDEPDSSRSRVGPSGYVRGR